MVNIKYYSILYILNCASKKQLILKFTTLKTLKEYDISDGEWISYHSKLCSVAASMEFPHTTTLAFYIEELCFSYINQWQLVIDAYHELEQLISDLNTFSTSPVKPGSFSDYDMQAIQIETKCRDYAYLMITSIKSLLDLFACVVDAVVNQTIREEHQMPDIKTVNRYLREQHVQSVHITMLNFLDKVSYPWIENISLYRNRLIHRGYRIKASFSFQKSDELKMKLFKGNNPDEELISIGELFQHFIKGLPQMEQLISDALLASVPELAGGQMVEMRYRTSGGFTEYHFKAIKEMTGE